MMRRRDFETGLSIEYAEKLKQIVTQLRDENNQLRQKIIILEIMIDELEQKNNQLNEKLNQIFEKTSLMIGKIAEKIKQ